MTASATPRLSRHRLPPPIHAVLMGDAPEREHHASALCWCHPEPILRDLATGAPIYRHWPAEHAPRRST